jgi:hypothetical protein
VQLRHHTTLTSEQYVIEQAWRQASLDRCPRHPQGGCDLARHGTYPRVEPPGMRVARWYCPQAQETFSLLPDCLAARLSGSLDEVERAVVAVETSGVEAAAQALRIEQSELPGAVRWLRRRRRGVRSAVLALVTAMPGGPLGAVPELRAVRQVLGTERALVALRGIGAEQLHALPPPLGFLPLRRARPDHETSGQHETGPDPPHSRRYLSLAGNEAGERRR